MIRVRHKESGIVVDVYGTRGTKYVQRLWPDDATDTEFLVWNGKKFVWQNADLFENIVKEERVPQYEN